MFRKVNTICGLNSLLGILLISKPNFEAISLIMAFIFVVPIAGRSVETTIWITEGGQWSNYKRLHY